MYFVGLKAQYFPISEMEGIFKNDVLQVAVVTEWSLL